MTTRNSKVERASPLSSVRPDEWSELSQKPGFVCETEKNYVRRQQVTIPPVFNDSFFSNHIYYIIIIINYLFFHGYGVVEILRNGRHNRQPSDHSRGACLYRYWIRSRYWDPRRYTGTESPRAVYGALAKSRSAEVQRHCGYHYSYYSYRWNVVLPGLPRFETWYALSDSKYRDVQRRDSQDIVVAC